MWIYKITNIQNNKMYIGQTTRSVYERFQRHMVDALSNRLDTHFARAIRKYGRDSFNYEVIDTATTEKELTEKPLLGKYNFEYYKEEPVSTNPDECKDVGEEISTSSKRKTI